MVIFEDADLDRAAAAAVKMLATNAGQVCSATTRMLVADAVYDEVLDRVTTGVQRLNPGVDFGPMITEAQYEKVLASIERARGDGLKSVIGGSAYESGPGSKGFYIVHHCWAIP